MPKPSEHTEQSQFMSVLRRLESRHPGLRWAFAVPNGFLDTKGKRLRAWREGMTAGVSDIFIPLPSKGFHGLFLEFKKDGGTLTKPQKAFIADMRARGYKAEVAYGFRQGLEILRDYIHE